MKEIIEMMALNMDYDLDNNFVSECFDFQNCTLFMKDDIFSCRKYTQKYIGTK